MDFARAFDVIDRGVLLPKLAVYGLSPETITLLVSFLTDMKETVHVDVSTSDLSNVEFPKVLLLDHYSFPFTSVASLYSSKHVVNFSQMIQQSTAVTLISESSQSHYRRMSTVY